MTLVVKFIGNGTRDYTSPQAWEDAAPSDLVAATTTWKGEMYPEGAGGSGEWTNTTVNISGSTTNASYYKWLAPAAGQAFNDHANKLTNRLAYVPANGVAMTKSGGYGTRVLFVSENYALVENLQIKHGSGGYNHAAFVSGAGAIVRSSILEGAADSVRNYSGIGAATPAFVNCVMWGKAGANFGTAFRNCTVYGGAQSNYSSVTAINTAVLTTTSFNGTFVGGSNYNASTDTTSPGANSLDNITASSQVQNLAGSSTYDFRLKSGNSLDGAGTPDTTYTLGKDILGQTRSVTAPSIGAFETVASAPSGKSLLVRQAVNRVGVY